MVERGTLDDQAWQTVLENSKERLQYLYTSGELSDLDIVFAGDGDSFKAHRLILSMSSPVFLAMLTGPLAAGKKLTFPEDPPQPFRKLLDHMYLDRMDLESVEEALEVYALAHKYQMDSAMKGCVQYIGSNMKAEMIPAVLETSVVYEDTTLNKKCKEVLGRDPNTIMLPETVSRLSKESLRDLLMDDTLAFSTEAVPFKGLIAWGKAQLGQQEKPSESALREKVGDLLKEVRFLDMSCDEFVDNVIGTKVLTPEECIHIQCAIRGSDPRTLPITIALHPARGRRLRPKKRLSCFRLPPPQFGHTDTLRPRERYCLIDNLSSDRNICVHRLDAPGGGTVFIEDADRDHFVLSSSACEGPEYVFVPPAALERGKRYNVGFRS